MSYISWEMTHTSVGGEKQAGISGGSQSPSWYSLRQGAHCPVDNGFAPTETECRLAETFLNILLKTKVEWSVFGIHFYKVYDTYLSQHFRTDQMQKYLAPEYEHLCRQAEIIL